MESGRESTVGSPGIEELQMRGRKCSWNSRAKRERDKSTKQDHKLGDFNNRLSSYSPGNRTSKTGVPSRAAEAPLTGSCMTTFSVSLDGLPSAMSLS